MRRIAFVPLGGVPGCAEPDIHLLPQAVKPRARTGGQRFLRDIPLDGDGSVNFPGAADIWMVAKGTSRSSSSSGRAAVDLRSRNRVFADELAGAATMLLDWLES